MIPSLAEIRKNALKKAHETINKKRKTNKGNKDNDEGDDDNDDDDDD